MFGLGFLDEEAKARTIGGQKNESGGHKRQMQRLFENGVLGAQTSKSRLKTWL